MTRKNYEAAKAAGKTPFYVYCTETGKERWTMNTSIEQVRRRFTSGKAHRWLIAPCTFHEFEQNVLITENS